MNEKSSDAVAWAYNRYIKGNPEREASFEEAGRQADLAQQIYDIRNKLHMSREELAELSGLTAEAIEDLEESDFDGSWKEATTKINMAFRQMGELCFVTTSEIESKPRTTRKFTKAELISQIAAKTKVPKKAVDEVLKSLIESIYQSLEEDRGITIPALGTFTVVKRSTRQGVNPQTGARIKIPASKTPRFRASKSLKEAVNKG